MSLNKQQYFTRQELHYRRWENEPINAMLLVNKYLPPDRKATGKKKAVRSTPLYSVAQVLAVEQAPNFQGWRALEDRAARRDYAALVKMQRLALITRGFDLDLPVLNGASPAQVEFGTSVRYQALCYVAIASLQLVVEDFPKPDVLAMVKDVVDNGDQPQESKTWIGHHSRISTRCLDPFAYWTGILKSSPRNPRMPASSIVPENDPVHDSRQCA